VKRAAPKRKPRKAAAGSRGISPQECLSSSEVDKQLREKIEGEGGAVIGEYLDPIGKNPLLLAALPVAKVEPTPFQRDVSDMHHKRLAGVIDKTGYFLDPIIAVTAPKGGFWTPNGGHRLAAMRRLGARAITALVVPKRELAWEILALNTEKAHNLRDRSLEVIRIYRDLMEEDGSRAEKQFEFYLEEASLATIGLCYEKNPRFSGAIYNSFVRRLTAFSDEKLSSAFKRHQQHAAMLLDLDERVAEVVKKLKAKGFVSPYLKTFVVARCNPLRFMKEPPELEGLIGTIRGKVDKFNVDRIRQEDIVSSGGAPDESD
jgi:ParB family chromosome partitioning protein